MTARSLRLLAPACAALIPTSSLALAEEANTNLLRAAAPATAYFTQDTPALVGASHYHLGVTFDLGSQLLVLRDPATGDPLMDGAIVSRRLTTHLAAGYGVSSRLELGAAFSTAIQAGDDRAAQPRLRRAALGDLQLRVKLALWRRHALQLSSSIELSLPTSSGHAFFGDSGATATGALLAGISRPGWSASVQAGYRLRRSTTLMDLEIDDELTGGVGARYQLLPARLWAQLEGYGCWGLQGKGNEFERPLELLAGLRLQVGDGWIVQAGVGLGLTQGYGTAESRGVISFGMVPHPDSRPKIARDWTPPDEDDDAQIAAAPPPPPAPTGPELTVRGDRIVLPDSVLFDLGGAEVKPDGQAILLRVLDLWRAHPEWVKLDIEGHTDVRGSQRLNQELSQRRADSVRASMIQLGADREVLSATGRGESQPLTTEQSEADHARNRRVEFIITSRPQER